MPFALSVRRAVAALAVLTLAGCDGPTALTEIEGVFATSEAGAIRIVNLTAAPVFTFVVGRDAAALVDWVPCIEPARCPPIPPGDARTVARASIVGDGERAALVYWWHVGIGPADGPVAGPLHVGTVRLR